MCDNAIPETHSDTRDGSVYRDDREICVSNFWENDAL
jgi:hypothetical protein